MKRHRIESKKRTVLGIDLGLNNTGLCKISFMSGCAPIVSNFAFGMGKSKLTNWPKQKEYINEFFLKNTLMYGLIGEADLVCIEKPFGIQGHGKVLVNLLGILQLFLVTQGTSHVEVPQTTLKKFATGYGRAEKSDMVLQAYKGRCGTNLIPEDYSFEAKTEDEVDAFFLALLGHCILSQEHFTKAHQEAVKKLVILK